MLDLKAQLPILLRGTQCLFSLIALATIGSSFKSITDSTGNTGRFGSSEADFILLMSFSAWVTTLAWLVCVGFLKYPPPKKLFTLVLDGIFAIFLFSGATALVVSSYAKHCDRYNGLVRCGNIRSAVAFSYLGFFSFLASIIFTFTSSGGLDLSSFHLNQNMDHEVASPSAEQFTAEYNAPITPTANKVSTNSSSV